MQLSIVLSLFVVVSVGAIDMDALWMGFKTEHKRSYTASEETMRCEIQFSIKYELYHTKFNKNF